MWDLIHFSSFLQALASVTILGGPWSIMLLDWNLVCRSTRLVEERLPTWMFPPMHQVEFWWILLRYPRIVGIGGMLLDHHGTLVRAFSWNVGVDLAIEAEILTLLQGLKFVKTDGFIQSSSRMAMQKFYITLELGAPSFGFLRQLPKLLSLFIITLSYAFPSISRVDSFFSLLIRVM